MSVVKFYYKIKEGTQMYEDAYKSFNSYKQWGKEDVKKEIENILGYDYGSSFVCSNTKLYVLANKIKAEDRCNYKKESVWFDSDEMLVAKKSSKEHKAYMEVCKKYGLKLYTVSDFKFVHFYSYALTLHCFGTEYVVELNKECGNEDLEELSKVKFLEMELEREKAKEEGDN